MREQTVSHIKIITTNLSHFTAPHGTQTRSSDENSV